MKTPAGGVRFVSDDSGLSCGADEIAKQALSPERQEP